MDWVLQHFRSGDDLELLHPVSSRDAAARLLGRARQDHVDQHPAVRRQCACHRDGMPRAAAAAAVLGHDPRRRRRRPAAHHLHRHRRDVDGAAVPQAGRRTGAALHRGKAAGARTRGRGRRGRRGASVGGGADRGDRRHRDEPRQRHRGCRGRQWQHSPAGDRPCDQRSPDRCRCGADHGAADAHAGLVWAGAALLGWVAGEVMATDPAIVPYLQAFFNGPVGVTLDSFFAPLAVFPQFANDGHGAEVVFGIIGIVIVLVAGGIWRKRKLQGVAHSATAA